MDDRSIILGIDVGSVSISVAEITLQKEIGKTSYQFHHGNISEALRRILTGFDLSRIRGIAVTSSTPSILKAARSYDNRTSVIAAARHFHAKIGFILVVGGEAFGLIVFDENGHYRTFRRNTSCAAGTGSFLDQQERRLALNGARELSDLGCSNREPIPKTASRCAVFAKTDLVHARQEGYTLEQICDGLCYGLAKNTVDTLSMHRELTTPIIFTGGVSENRAVVHHIESMTGKHVVVDETGMYGAIGAAFLLAEEYGEQDFPQIVSVNDVLADRVLQKKYFHAPLTLALSDYPVFGGVEQYEFVGGDSTTPYPVEVDIYGMLKSSSDYAPYLGVDIGSTSTKAILLTTDGTVLAGAYTSTAGRPVAAVQRILASIEDITARKDIALPIAGAATTGSGRKFAGKIMGADLIMDEISAHARAAVEIDPNVDTIIEIGGQDSKFTTLKSGRVTFSAMNNVCAAGTGSFIEELAQKLGCPLADYSKRSENQKSPMVSDRCTVFMERDLNHYLAEGYAVDEVLASVLHAIRETILPKSPSKAPSAKLCFSRAPRQRTGRLWLPSNSGFKNRYMYPNIVTSPAHWGPPSPFRIPVSMKRHSGASICTKKR